MTINLAGVKAMVDDRLRASHIIRLIFSLLVISIS